MTVKELRKHLRGVDPETEVVIMTTEDAIIDKAGDLVRYYTYNEITCAFLDNDRLSAEDPPEELPSVFVLGYDGYDE